MLLVCYGLKVWVKLHPVLCVSSCFQNWWQIQVPAMYLIYRSGANDTICTNCTTVVDSSWPYVVFAGESQAILASSSLIQPYQGCGHELLLDFGRRGQLRMKLTVDGQPPLDDCSSNFAATGDARIFEYYRVKGLKEGVENWYILGLPFLRQFYTVFEYSAMRVGFYPAVQGGS